MLAFQFSLEGHAPIRSGPRHLHGRRGLKLMRTYFILFGHSR